ncbi:hypothetical protein V8D89_006963 [Ganoderma adspersum]
MHGSKSSCLAVYSTVRMIDILSSTLVTARHPWKARTGIPRVRWPGAFTAAVRAGAKESAKHVVLSADSAKVLQPPPMRSKTTGTRHPEVRDTKAIHKRRRPARRPAVQAYRVWSKRRRISRRHAVKLQGTMHMEEVVPAPLEEVFLMEEILPAPLQEFETGPRVHTAAGHSLLLLDAGLSVLTPDAGCGHSEARFNDISHASRALNYWQYIRRPSQSVDACPAPFPLHWQLEVREPVIELGAPSPSLSTPALAGIGINSLVLPSSEGSCSSLTGPELGNDNVFLVGGAEHEGVRGPSFAEYALVPGAFVDGGEDPGDDVEFIRL